MGWKVPYAKLGLCGGGKGGNIYDEPIGCHQTMLVDLIMFWWTKGLYIPQLESSVSLPMLSQELEFACWGDVAWYIDIACEI